MKDIILDGTMLTSKEKAHACFKKKLGLPGYYGANLDALFDLLVTRSQPGRILLINCSGLQKNLGPYGQAIIETFQAAAAANSRLDLLVL